MRVGLISKSDERGGGASRVACRLRDLLEGDGANEVDHWVGLPRPSCPMRSQRGGVLGDKLFRAMRFLSRLAGFQDFLTVELFAFDRARVENYELLHVHDISSALSPFTLKAIAQRRPVVWTFHDCSPFTGGCLYPMECEAYFAGGCHDCPQLSEWPLCTRFDHTGWIQRYKISLINDHIATAVCPSRWLAERAIAAGVRSDILQIVPNSVDTEIFRPLDKAALRVELGLPGRVPLVLLSAMTLRNRYKGGSLAAQALARVQIPLCILGVGGQADRFEGYGAQHRYVPVGPISDVQTLSKYFAAADLFLLPSLEETFGLVLIETMASGTPAIAFASGGIPEILVHDESGWLVDKGDVDGFAKGITLGVTDSERRARWGAFGRARVEAEYNDRLFLSRHREIYRKVARAAG